MTKSNNKLLLEPTITITDDGKKIYWYSIAQLEHVRHLNEMARIERMFKNNENNSD